VPVRIDGVDPASEPDFSFFPEKLQEGRFLEPGDRLSAFVGRGLADRLDLRVGSRFVVTAQAADGEVEAQLLRVTGIFRTGLPEADEGLVHIPLETAREWLAAPGAATVIGMLLPDSRGVPAMQAAVQAGLGSGETVVSSWREATPELDAAVRLDDIGAYIFHAILFFIIALAVLNAVLMSVMFRRREFGVLQALGLSRLETGAQVMMEGMLLTAVAGVIGAILGVSVTWLIWRDGLDFSFALQGEFTFSGIVLDPVIVPEFRLRALLQSVFSIAVVGLIASVYPALHAMRIDIAEAMKFEK
jgi:ABC-type lipoprotein release transport system permease subunit